MPIIREGEPYPNLAISSEASALVLIHGTGASSDIEADSCERWWHQGSEFDLWLCERITHLSGEQLLSEDILRFVWSGANSEADRKKAAISLLELIRPLEQSGRSISIIAHSHGGNIAREAYEMSLMSRTSKNLKPWSIICIGTPFFHYGIISIAKILLIKISMFVISLAAFYIIPNFVVSKIPTLEIGVYQAVFGVICAYYFIRIIMYFLETDMRKYLFQSRFRDGVFIKNIYSCRDEALALLKSLNKTVDFMRRNDDKPWIRGPFHWARAYVVLFCFFTITLIFNTAYRGLDNPLIFINLIEVIFIISIITIILVFIYGQGNHILDILTTNRLKALAYGNDCDAPIIGVEAFPWPGAENCAILLHDEIEDDVEIYISERTSGIWAKVRANLKPNATLLDQEFTKHFGNLMNGDELAHTVYYRIESFSDLIANHLKESGHWQLMEPVR